ncbi:MAG: hypothetical protein K6F21_02595 [Bacteroidales bacterium]|nr:hypothetical protein [Bacteroidales bacterium]
MKRKILYYIAALIWGVPGIIITIKGLSAYAAMPSAELWWLLLITAAVLAGFFFMFRKIVDKYSARIAAQPEKTSYDVPGNGPEVHPRNTCRIHCLFLQRIGPYAYLVGSAFLLEESIKLLINLNTGT